MSAASRRAAANSSRARSPFISYSTTSTTSFNVLALQRGVDIRGHERAAGLPEVVWDPDRINEVLGNLLSNAFKFTPRGGRVDLDV